MGFGEAAGGCDATGSSSAMRTRQLALRRPEDQEEASIADRASDLVSIRISIRVMPLYDAK